MIRILTLATAAAALIAMPASAESIRIATAGKSPTQLHAEIKAAATKLCDRAIGTATFPQEERARCMKETIGATVAQAQDPALTEIAAKFRLAQR